MKNSLEIKLLQLNTTKKTSMVFLHVTQDRKLQSYKNKHAAKCFKVNKTINNAFD